MPGDDSPYGPVRLLPHTPHMRRTIQGLGQPVLQPWHTWMCKGLRQGGKHREIAKQMFCFLWCSKPLPHGPHSWPLGCAWAARQSQLPRTARGETAGWGSSCSRCAALPQLPLKHEISHRVPLMCGSGCDCYVVIFGSNCFCVTRVGAVYQSRYHVFAFTVTLHAPLPYSTE